MNSRRLLVVLTAIFTCGLLVWAIVDTFKQGITLRTSAVMVYLALVSLTLWMSRIGAVKNISTSCAVPNEAAGHAPLLEERPGISERAQAIILEIIKARGRAKRQDLLPQVGLSKSSLGRLLDQMEAKGLIRQEGERKASYYVLSG